MPNHDHFARFDEWWGSIGEQSRASLDEKTARTSFVAGCRIGVRMAPQQFRFQCGKWKVTVTATNTEEAKAKAVEVLNRRAEKFMTSAPKGGWRLSEITSEAENRDAV